MNHFQIFIEFVTILLLFWLWCMWDLSSPTRDPTHTSCTGSQIHHWKTTGKPGKSLLPTLTKLFLCVLFTSKSYIYKSLTRHMVWYVCSHSVGFSFYFLISFEAHRFLIIVLVDSLGFSKCSGKKKVMSPTDRVNFTPSFPIWKFYFF